MIPIYYEIASNDALILDLLKPLFLERLAEVARVLELKLQAGVMIAVSIPAVQTSVLLANRVRSVTMMVRFIINHQMMWLIERFPQRLWR